MAIDRAVADLQAHRDELMAEVERVNRAIAVLTGGVPVKGPARLRKAAGPVAEPSAPAKQKRGRPKGRKLSDETRAKMREAWARRKAQPAEEGHMASEAHQTSPAQSDV